MPVSNQIEKREQENPDNIDEMPVQTNHFHRSIIVRMKNAPPCLNEQIGKKAQTDNHMYRVHAGHGEIQEKENLRVVKKLRRAFVLKSKARNQVFNVLLVIFKT